MSYPHRSHFQYDRVPGRRRVVITGVGAVSAAGVGVPPLWDTLLAGKGSVGAITLYESASLPIKIGGEVRGFDATRHIDAALKPGRMARHTQFAVIAAQEALRDAGVHPGEFGGDRVAVIVGSSMGSPDIIEGLSRQVERNGSRGVSPAFSVSGNMQAAPAAIAEMLGAPNTTATTVTNTCSSGVDAVGIGADMIRLGRREIVVAGGADAPLTDVTTTAIAASGICTLRSDHPATAGRPFDREREGGVLGEGAGIVILESLESALENGRTIYAEITGMHSCPDSRRDRPTSGLEITMRGAMENAGREPADIDFVSAWGCGHPAFDRCETDAIKAVLGEHAYRVAVSSIKGAIGIPLGAAGALQLVTTALSHRHNILPPTVNWTHRDVDCDLDYVGLRPRRMKLRNTLHNAHGMSGGNITVLLSAVD